VVYDFNRLPIRFGEESVVLVRLYYNPALETKHY